MRLFDTVPLTIVIALFSTAVVPAQRNFSIAENAALRYWSAFSEVQDATITDQQAQEVNAILDGTAPYDDLKYKDLVEKNTLALEIMARGTSIPDCDWGLDYGLGHDIPVDYARRALVLGRLNVLYAFHLLKNRKIDEAVRALAAGIRFSHDVGNGGSLFATLIAKDLLVSHLRLATDALRSEHLSATQRSQLQGALSLLGRGLDWPMAARRDLEALHADYAGSAQASAALKEITSAYIVALNDPSKLPVLNQAIEKAPQSVANVIPNAKRVLEQKEDLDNKLRQTRSLIQ